MKLNPVFFALALGVTPLAAFAHAPKIGVHGGPQADAGSFHVEVVAKDATVDVYLIDHSSRDVASEGFQGLAIFVAEDKSLRIQLKPAGGNKLSGTAPAPVTSTKGIVQITTPTGSKVQGKFD